MTPLLLCLAVLIPTGSIARDMLRDAAKDRTEQEITRLSAELPPARESLAWPEPLSPLDLPSVGDTDALAAAELNPRLPEYAGRHRIGTALGAPAQRALWDSPTGQFWLIVDNIGDLWEPCSHCASPEDGEPAHVGCPGCSCPCSLMEAAA